MCLVRAVGVCFFKQKTAYEMRISDWSADVCSSDLSLANLLSLDPDEVDRVKADLEKAAGFQPVQVAAKLDYAQYAAVSVRLPELLGVAPARGFSRYYPAGAAVGHLIGYVGLASAEDYENSKEIGRAHVRTPVT